MSSPAAERVFSGEVASRGLATGVIDYCRVRTPAEIAVGSPAEERRRFDGAVAQAAERLAALAAESGALGAEMLEFQLALLGDDELIAPVRAAIGAGVAAAAAWHQILDRQIADYQTAEDDYFRARALDLVDLRDRILMLLAGGTNGATQTWSGAIFVADNLAPSRFLETDWSRYRGAALTGGSASSHVAILARARGVPLVVGLDADAGAIVSGAEAILDAEEGRLIQAPTSTTRTRYEARFATNRAIAAAEAEHLSRPAVTRSGVPVQVCINVDDPRVLAGIDADHCDGVGLTRTEFLFYGSAGLPDEATQLRAYRRLLDWAGDRPVTIRTLDAGGDKPIPGLTPDDESNPFLGLRGLRLSLARPEVFRVQLRALARAAAVRPIKVMLPMVTTPRELAETRALFVDVVAGLTGEDIEARLPSLGMMVEVPSAAINVAAFDADFYSIGSNDLVQYVTATGRDCAAVAALHDPLDPAVLELIGRVVAHGARVGREVSLCGDMASDPRCLPALLDLGLRNVSVAPAAVARVKARIAGHG